MHIGVREFRGKFSEVVNGNKVVTVTNNGKVVGEFTPATIIKPTADRKSWLEDRIAFRTKWQETTPDWLDRMLDQGWDGEGEPFDEPTFR